MLTPRSGDAQASGRPASNHEVVTRGPFDFRNLVGKYSSPITIEEESGGYYDYGDGGKWKPKTQTRETRAAVFNLSGRDVRGYSMQYGEGGTFTREDVKIYIHEPLLIGTKVTFKGNTFTVSACVDYSDHAHGLRIYVAKRAGSFGEADDALPARQAARPASKASEEGERKDAGTEDSNSAKR